MPSFPKPVTPIIRQTCAVLLVTILLPSGALAQSSHSVARQWNEALLAAIRLDQARPTVHARNLFHLAAVMWDASAPYAPNAIPLFHQEAEPREHNSGDREQAISYAAYRLLRWRFHKSPNVAQTDTALDRLMAELGYDVNQTSTTGSGPSALGNRVAETIIRMGLSDGANEEQEYANRTYQPINPRLNPHQTGNPAIRDPDRWQQMDLPDFVGQSGQQAENYPPFVGPEWGDLQPFALNTGDITWHERDGRRWPVYLDAGPPPRINGTAAERLEYQRGFEEVIAYSSELDPKDNRYIDVSPETRGNNTLGSNDGSGRRQNPVTGQPYATQLVAAGDYFRVLAEFWADGPSSETPPGHWFTLLNIVADQPSFRTTFGESVIELSRLDWDLRSYLTLGGAMHDAAIAAWSHKGWYDFTRPISAIRYLCDQGQASDPALPNYSETGIHLNPGVIELITADSATSGERHHHLAGANNANIGQIAVRSWRGPDFIQNPDEDVAGVDWILCGDWWPYQRPNFVSPPFAAYVSGHSTYSRAAAEVLTRITNTPYFPGGLGIFNMRANDYLVFEKGPSRTLQLMWATYQDAADESGLSRLYGGIHHRADDIAGRKLGFEIGHRAYSKALEFFEDD